MTKSDVAVSTKRDLSMRPDQPVEILVNRRGGTYAVPAAYAGDSPTRRLEDGERAAVVAASRLLADALAGGSVDERELQRAVDRLHELSLEVEGAPRFRLGDGRLIDGGEMAYRARLG